MKKISIILAGIGLLVASVSVADIVANSSVANHSYDVDYTELQLATPASTVTGDLLLATFAVHGGDGVVVIDSAPAGWSLIARTDNNASVALFSYYKFATSSGLASTTWTFDSLTRAAGGISRFTGVDSGSPIDAIASSTGQSATAIAPSATTSAANYGVVALFATNVGRENNNFFGTSTGMTKLYDKKFPPLGPTISAQYVLQAATGTTGTKSSDVNQGSRDWSAQTIVLKKAPVFSCTGGTTSTSGGNTIHTFNSGGSLICSGTSTVQVLVVAGGGGGGAGNGGGGGGGAGGVVYDSDHQLTPQTYTVTIGAGGAGGDGFAERGDSGSNSVFDNITALGGGGGGADASGNAATSGGSGGGGASLPSGSAGGGSTQGDSGGGTGYGTSGGSGTNAGNLGAGGGGGAGSTGSNGSSSNGGAGGNGVANSITGSSVTYAGGGGGGTGNGGGTAGSGGTGGGGAGGNNGGTGIGVSGTANTGGGGGGGSDGYASGGTGGSGVVIVSYPTP